METADVATASLIANEVDRTYEGIRDVELLVHLAYKVEVHGQREHALIDSRAEKSLIDHHSVNERDYPRPLMKELPQR